MTTPRESRCSPTGPTAPWRSALGIVFAVNAAWLTCAAMTEELLRAAGCLAGASRTGPGRHHPADLIDVAARTAAAAGNRLSTCRRTGTARPSGSTCSRPPAALPTWAA